jgi:sulfur carrier protein
MDTTTTTMTTTLEREIIVNGQPLATAAATLADLVDGQGFAGVKVATAVNGDFVAERLRAKTSLSAGDRIEILTVRQGG